MTLQVGGSACSHTAKTTAREKRYNPSLPAFIKAKRVLLWKKGRRLSPLLAEKRFEEALTVVQMLDRPQREAVTRQRGKTEGFLRAEGGKKASPVCDRPAGKSEERRLKTAALRLSRGADTAGRSGKSPKNPGERRQTLATRQNHFRPPKETGFRPETHPSVQP